MKKEILRQAKYRFNFDRDIYYNPQAKKAFSIEFVDDNSEEVLAQCIHENSNGNGWKFYFNHAPSESATRELESVLS